jgi:hypothetical protein
MLIYFDSSKDSPFRVNDGRMVSTWDDWDKGIWEEVKDTQERHIHQDLENDNTNT